MAPLSDAATTAIRAASVLLSALVLAYRWSVTASVRRWVDGAMRRITGRPDWGWLDLPHVLAPVVVVAVASVGWNLLTLGCSNDALALLASGRAALHGQNPFVVTFCGGPPDPIPYGLAAVVIHALAASSGSAAGIWVAWELVALLVLPLVWFVSGEDRRYVSVMVACSVFYLPNIVSNISVENAIVPLSVLLALWAIRRPRHRTAPLALAAFLSTARFPALFPLVGLSFSRREDRLRGTLLVLAIFAVSAATAYALWGWDAIGVVYLGQFVRVPADSLNLFALLLHEGWLVPSTATVAVQSVLLLAVVVFVGIRRYTPEAACALPLLAVVSLSQYLTFHFLLWLVPLLLLGPSVRAWLLLYGLVAAVDESLFLWYLGQGQGIWWPWEVTGVLLSAVLVWVFVLVLRTEEARPRRVAGPGASDRAFRPAHPPGPAR